MFVIEENNAFTMKWPNLIAEVEKILFYEEKSLVGLTPGVLTVFTFLCPIKKIAANTHAGLSASTSPKFNSPSRHLPKLPKKLQINIQ